MKNQRLLELDALRGIAALAVVFYHYFYRYNKIYGHENVPVEWISKGHLGVNLFFMVSGFVIFWTLVRIEKPFDFIVSRFSRLYPVYWAAIFLTFSVVAIFGLPGREVSLPNAIANVLMFQEYLRIPHVDRVYWTLTVELTFYFWIFLLYLGGQLKKIEWVCMLLLLVSILYSAKLLSIHIAIYKIFLLKDLPFFAAGICIFNIVNYGINKLSAATLFIALMATAFIYSLTHLVIFTFFFGIFYLAVSGNLKLLSAKPLVFLGSVSYSLYLIHQNIGYVVINKFYEMNWNPLAGIAAAIATSLLLAFLLTKFVEGPSQKYIRQRYKHNEKIQRFAQKLTLSGIR